MKLKEDKIKQYTNKLLLNTMNPRLYFKEKLKVKLTKATKASQGGYTP